LAFPSTIDHAYVCSALPVVTEVASNLKWAPAIQEMADRIIKGMEKSGAMPFNAVHLRVEKDARDWSTIMGGQQVSSVSSAGTLLPSVLHNLYLAEYALGSI
jgi:hypothetical protein